MMKRQITTLAKQSKKEEEEEENESTLTFSLPETNSTNSLLTPDLSDKITTLDEYILITTLRRVSFLAFFKTYLGREIWQ